MLLEAKYCFHISFFFILFFTFSFTFASFGGEEPGFWFGREFWLKAKTLSGHFGQLFLAFMHSKIK